MTLHRRLTRLEAKVPPLPPDDGLFQKRWSKVVARFFRLFEQAAALLNAEEEKEVEKALTELVDTHGRGGPFARWLDDLWDGRGRLPKLQPVTMKDVLLAWLAPGVSGGVVCKSCGLEYPHQSYHPMFAACPECALGEWDWAHLVKDHDRGWKELDGCVGSRERVRLT